MSFGWRRFDRIVLDPGGLPVARFLPLDMSLDAEHVAEDTLRTLLHQNEMESCPLDAPEEALALSALELFAKKHTNKHPSTTARSKQTRDAKKGS